MHKPTDASVTQKEANKLIRRLAHRRSDWPSKSSLRDLDPPIVDALLKIIAGWECTRTVSRAALLSPLLIFLLGMYFGSFAAPCLHLAFICLLVFTIQPYIAVQQRYAVYALTQTDDIRVLPTLIQSTRYAWGKHPHILYAIQRLLKQVTEEHVGLLNWDTLNRLSSLAIDPISEGSAFDYDLALVTLNAFAKFGGDRELRDVKAVARLTAYDAEQRKIVHIAQELMPEMAARLQRQQVPQTLLRASAATPALPDTLLRATHATTPEPPQQLLRASTSEHPETDA
jgi:hypothetical protein